MVDRLTARTDGGIAYLVNVKQDEQEVYCKSRNTAQRIIDSWERLAAYEDIGLTPEEIAHAIDLLAAEKDGRLVELPPVKGADIDNPLEPLKVYFALKSEVMKYEYRAEHEPQKINVLDYTIIKSLQDVLTRAEAEAAMKGEEGAEN